MQLSHALIVTSIGLAGVSGFTVLGHALENNVVGMSEARLAESGRTPAVASTRLGGVIPVGIATRLVRRFPNQLAGTFGFRGATRALGVMADKGLVRSSARHAARVAKIEKPGGAWRAARPFYTNAAFDAGRRGVGNKMFDGVELFTHRRVAELKRFGNDLAYNDPIEGFDPSRFQIGAGYTGDDVLITTSQMVRRAVLRRTAERLTGGKVSWDQIRQFDSSAVEQIRRLHSEPQGVRFGAGGPVNQHPVQRVTRHYEWTLQGGPVGADITATKRALLGEIGTQANILELGALGADRSADFWSSTGAYHSLNSFGTDERLTRTMRFQAINVQHASDLEPQTARLTIPNLTDESGLAPRLRIEIAPGFAAGEDFAPWVTGMLAQHPRHGRGGNIKPTVLTFGR